MDFEGEFADFLSRDVPRCADENRVRRSSNTIVSNANNQERLEYNENGTINCCDLNYTTIVCIQS